MLEFQSVDHTRVYSLIYRASLTTSKSIGSLQTVSPFSQNIKKYLVFWSIIMPRRRISTMLACTEWAKCQHTFVSDHFTRSPTFINHTQFSIVVWSMVSVSPQNINVDSKVSVWCTWIYPLFKNCQIWKCRKIANPGVASSGCRSQNPALLPTLEKSVWERSGMLLLMILFLNKTAPLVDLLDFGKWRRLNRPQNFFALRAKITPKICPNNDSWRFFRFWFFVISLKW